MGGGIRMGNTCKPMAVSFQCMTKPTTIKKIKKNNDIVATIILEIFGNILVSKIQIQFKMYPFDS